jgi:hypothetical protein
MIDRYPALIAQVADNGRRYQVRTAPRNAHHRPRREEAVWVGSLDGMAVYPLWTEEQDDRLN